MPKLSKEANVERNAMLSIKGSPGALITNMYSVGKSINTKDFDGEDENKDTLSPSPKNLGVLKVITSIGKGVMKGAEKVKKGVKKGVEKILHMTIKCYIGDSEKHSENCKAKL